MYQLELGTRIRLVENYGLNENFAQDLKELKRLGFDCIEVSLGQAGGYKMHMERCTEVVADGLKQIADAGLTLNSIHMPFQRFVYISSHDESVRAFAADACVKLIEECNAFKPKHYVFHSKVGPLEDPALELRKEALVKSFRQMVAATEANVCLENMAGSFPSTTDQMMEILGQVEGGKCCIDLNHFLHEKPEDGIVKLAKWLKTIHVSDHDGVYERHWLPKQGANDWMKILAALEQVGYQNAFVYEVGMGKFKACWADLRANYDELFEEYNKASLH